MVVISRVWTRAGDSGRTRLADSSEVAKTDARVAAFGDVDEANAVIGMALAAGGLDGRVTEVLRLVQNELFDVGADLATPLTPDPHPPDQETPALRIGSDSVARLERWCDEFTETLPTLRSFILPGGTPAAATLHLARTVTRRAERAAWAATEAHGDTATTGGVNPEAIRYLNRLSDLLFVLTRAVNGVSHEVLWVPGGDRAVDPPPT